MEEVREVARKLDEEKGNQSKDDDDENLRKRGAKSSGDEEENGSNDEDEQEEDDDNEREAETLSKWNGYMPPDFYYYKEGHEKQGQLNLEKAILAPRYNSLKQYNSCQVVNIFLDQYTGTQEYNEEGCKYLLAVYADWHVHKRWLVGYGLLQREWHCKDVLRGKETV
jgi:hypothetical protein